jgi:hypothetical protein
MVVPLKYLLVSHAEHDQVLHRDLVQIALIRNRPSSACGMLLAPRVKLAPEAVGVLVQAGWGVSRANPGVGAVLAVLPGADEFAVVGQAGEGAIVGELRPERSSGRQVEELSVGRGHEVAASVALLPPNVLVEVVQRIDG